MEEIQKMRRVSRVEGADEGGSKIINKGTIQRILGFIVEKKAPFAVIAIVALVGYGVYAKYFDLTDAEIAQKELAKAVAAVSELMILPEGDEPVLATVTDAEALTKQQTFFTGAVNGDQLLLFPRNLKAILYSPSRNKIVNAGPIEQQPQAAAAPQTNADSTPHQTTDADGAGQAQTNAEIQRDVASIQQSPVLKIAFYNGTKVVGLANEMESKLKSVSSDFETVVKTNAGSKDYKETIVIDLTGGTKSAEAQSIAFALGAKVGALPSGEIIPDADILVIAGGR